jgi:hypothetical protein
LDILGQFVAELKGMKILLVATLASLALAAGCRTMRVGACQAPAHCVDELHPVPPPSAKLPASVELSVSTPGAPRADAPLPAPNDDALYPSDLGPEFIDVSSYPLEQKKNYEVFSQACARCHSLSRSLFLPPTSTRWWRFYMLGMRVRAGLRSEQLTGEEAAAILEFLEYDEQARKRSPEYAKTMEALERRFAEINERRVRDFYRNFRAPQRVLNP